MWKKIDFEPAYEVSDDGRVRNIETKKEKSLRRNHGGYLRVTLYPSGTTYTIHRLVARVFLPPDPDRYHVNHKDGNKTNNNLTNLEWCTSGENFHHALRTGLLVPKDIRGFKNHMAKFTQKDLDNIKSLYYAGYRVSAIAKSLGFPYERVRRFLKGQHY